MSGRADATVRWMTVLSRFEIAPGKFRIVLARQVAPIGGSREIIQTSGTVVAFEFPWLFGAVRTHFRVCDGSNVAFVSPTPRDSTRFRAALESCGFVVETSGIPKVFRPVAPMFSQYAVWLMAKHRGQLACGDEEGAENGRA